MRAAVISLTMLACMSIAGAALAIDLPPTAKKASILEFKALADAKKVKVEIFDLGTPVSADLVWNWKKKSITGKADVNGKTINVNARLSFKGEQACATNKGEKPTCHFIYIDGNKFYEVRDDMQVHAVSTVAQ
ncbi:hypothetical protein MRS76_17835 [Rhizobiaceae bacterium n13]|uniref:Uncharacterized protein n=1 Tax=Ferirhizobium litorale TaxID=2927786 RepID=A0AAE3QDZ9_9HYPH|nr:hypothetical protein [Fererhizobium litorale]MDI7863818.1 hypothetical protein [Fererhizobium litorale]MDI7924082.1 hypothetical protein [Fererhizobium litorale]